MDEFYSRAYDLVSSAQARAAFDIQAEPDTVRDAYGRNEAGQRMLLARRLVESGVRLVTLSYGGWDMHQKIRDGITKTLPPFDQAYAALIRDLERRGLLDTTLVMVSSEFGRTPKIEYSPSTGAGNASAPAGTIQPGRDHWPRAFSNIWAGGGIRTGQVIGATDKRGEDPIERVCSAGDFLATIYRHLGIDSAKTFIKDFNGRPTPIVDHGKPIPELMG